MLYTIYRVTHRESGKVYIGKHQTPTLEDGYMGSGKMIRRAVKKHGLSAFKKEVLHVFETESEMNAKEAELVTEEFCLREDTYNLCPGGNGGWGYVNANGINNTEAKKAAARRNLKKAILQPYDLAARNVKIAAGMRKYASEGFHWKGRRHSESTKEKLSIVASRQTGSKNSQFGKMWITNGSVNQKIGKDESLPTGWYKGRSNLSS